MNVLAQQIPHTYTKSHTVGSVRKQEIEVFCPFQIWIHPKSLTCQAAGRGCIKEDITE